MANEHTFETYAQSLMGFALQARNALVDGKDKEFGIYLTDLNQMLRKVQWRKGVGIRNLPDLAEIKEMRGYLTKAEAATRVLLKYNEERLELQKANGKIKTSPNSILNKNYTISQLTTNIEKFLAILLEDLKHVREIVKTKPWENNLILSRPENKSTLLQLLKREGFYKSISITEILPIIQHLNLQGYNFSGCDLRDANFVLQNLSNINFTKANLKGANLSRTNLINSNFSSANIENSNLSGAVLIGANFKETNVRNANVDGANFTNVKNLTWGQVLQMKNLGSTKGLPRSEDANSKNPKATVKTIAA